MMRIAHSGSPVFMHPHTLNRYSVSCFAGCSWHVRIAVSVFAVLPRNPGLRSPTISIIKNKTAIFLTILIVIILNKSIIIVAVDAAAVVVASVIVVFGIIVVFRWTEEASSLR